MEITMPKCEECQSNMKFFDEAWVENGLLVIASIVCTNHECQNTSVMYIKGSWTEEKKLS